MDSHLDVNWRLFFFISSLIGGYTAFYANTKGKNPFLWFFIGFFLGIFAPLILWLFYPNAKEKGGGENKGGDGMPTMTVNNPDPLLERQDASIVSSKYEEEDKLWYYLDQNHEQMGPVSVIALRELWNRGQLILNSYVWSKGMDQWQKIESLQSLRDLLNKD